MTKPAETVPKREGETNLRTSPVLNKVTTQMSKETRKHPVPETSLTFSSDDDMAEEENNPLFDQDNEDGDNEDEGEGDDLMNNMEE